LNSLTFIGGGLDISTNPSLTSLTGLDNIDAGSIIGLSIYHNDSLSTCEVQSICDYLANPIDTIDIHDNASGCDSIAEVEAACALISVNDIANDNAVSIYPNPSSTLITIETSPALNKSQLSILDVHGHELTSRQITEPKTQIDIIDLPSGVYFVRVTNDWSVGVGKIVKK